MSAQQPSSACGHGQVMEGSERKSTARDAGKTKVAHQGHRFYYLPELQVTRDTEVCGRNPEYSEKNDSADSHKCEDVQQMFRDNRFSGGIYEDIEGTMRMYDLRSPT